MPILVKVGSLWCSEGKTTHIRLSCLCTVVWYAIDMPLICCRTENDKDAVLCCSWRGCGRRMPTLLLGCGPTLIHCGIVSTCLMKIVKSSALSTWDYLSVQFNLWAGSHFSSFVCFIEKTNFWFVLMVHLVTTHEQTDGWAGRQSATSLRDWINSKRAEDKTLWSRDWKPLMDCCLLIATMGVWSPEMKVLHFWQTFDS